MNDNCIPHQSMVAPMPQSAIDCAFDELNESCRINLNLAEELRSRLSGVICPAPEADTKGDPLPPSSCMMKGRIDSMIYDVHQTNKLIQSTINELQI